MTTVYDHQPTTGDTMTHQLIIDLLHLYYANASGIRSQLLAFYRHSLPGMPRNWYAGYVRFLISHYPRAMRSCIIALHEHHARAAAIWCGR